MGINPYADTSRARAWAPGKAWTVAVVALAALVSTVAWAAPVPGSKASAELTSTGLAHLDRPEGVATLTETVTFEEPIIIRFPVGRYTIVSCPFWTFWPRMPPPP